MSEKFQCMPYDISCVDYNQHTEIRLWCIMKEQARAQHNNALVRIRDFYTHIFIELTENNSPFFITPIDQRTAIRYVKTICGGSLISYDIVESMIIPEHRIPIFFYKGNETRQYIKVSFSTLAGKRKFFEKVNQELFPIHDKKTGAYHNILVDVYENDIPDLWKYLCEVNATPCQSFTFDQFTRTHEVGKDDIHEFIVSKDNIKYDSRENAFIGVPKVLSFDIEALSYDGKSFPEPFRIRDEVFLITCYIKHYQTKEDTDSGRKIAIHLGRTGLTIDGAELIETDTEEELYDAFFKLIERERPNIILGYNILGFDNKYISERMELLMKKIYNCSFQRYHNITVESSSWSSSAHHNVEINYLNIPGILIMDMYTQIRRDFKYRNYKLDTVSKIMLDDSKVDMIYLELFKTRLAWLSGDESVLGAVKKIIEYGIQDAYLPLRLFEHCNYWQTYLQMSNIMRIKINEIYTRGQRIRSKTQLYYLSSKKGYIFVRRPFVKIDTYTGGYVFDMTAGVHDPVMTLDFNSLYPSIMCAYNMCTTTFIEKKDWHKYKEGSYIPIVIDAKTEYRFIGKHIRKGIMTEIVENMLTSRSLAKKRMGVLKSQIEKETDPSRLYALTSDLILTDKEQNTLKISVNSLYGGLGFTGEDTNDSSVMKFVKAMHQTDFDTITYKKRFLKNENKTDFAYKPIALCITRMGRYVIDQAMHDATTNFPVKKIYGDTDSIFLTPTTNMSIEEVVKLGNDIATFLNGRFTKPLNIVLEKVFRMIGVTRKRYVHLDYDLKTYKLPNVDQSHIKGLLGERRDNCKFQQEVFLLLVHSIMKGMTYNETRKEILKRVRDLFNGDVELKDLAMSGSVSESYKSETCPMSVFKKVMSDKETPLVPGERVEFVVTQTEGATKQGEKIKLLDDCIMSGAKVDYLYYLEKRLKKAIDQIWTIAYPDDKSPCIGDIVTFFKTVCDENEEVMVQACDKVISTL